MKRFLIQGYNYKTPEVFYCSVKMKANAIAVIGLNTMSCFVKINMGPSLSMLLSGIDTSQR